MKQALLSLLRLPREATERDYIALEFFLRRMDAVDVDQLDGMSSNQPPLTMLVHVGEYTFMEKKRVRALVDDFREEQAILGEGVLLAPFPSSDEESPG